MAVVGAPEDALDLHTGKLLPEVGTVCRTERVPRVGDVVLMAVVLDDAGSGSPLRSGVGRRR